MSPGYRRRMPRRRGRRSRVRRAARMACASRAPCGVSARMGRGGWACGSRGAERRPKGAVEGIDRLIGRAVEVKPEHAELEEAGRAPLAGGGGGGTAALIGRAVEVKPEHAELEEA